MKAVLLGGLLALAGTVAGIALRDDHYRLRTVGLPADQAVLDHRDSAYTSCTWVGSESENYLQLRFFDKVEGGICLRPTWTELQDIATGDPRLAHLVPSSPQAIPAPPASWPWAPADPGTLPNSAYVRFFPAGVLLNQRLMATAGGDPRQADPHILVVGLGSGVGVLGLAHHFPKASITVVDIDQQVEDVVRARVPLARWLETQRNADGSPRLELVVADARQFVRFEAPRKTRRYDLIILDAYTAGSTIPSHLMTREFFAECASAMDGSGILLANIIGSYGGGKHLVLGGALRSMRAPGPDGAESLPEVRAIPVLSSERPGFVDTNKQRNHITLASKQPLDSRRNAAGWQRLREWIPFPELPSNRYITKHYYLIAKDRWASAKIPAEPIDALLPDLRSKMKPQPVGADSPQGMIFEECDDSTVISQVSGAVSRWATEHASSLPGTPLGWSDSEGGRVLIREETDWLKAARESWRFSINNARDDGTHGGDALVGPRDGSPERDERTPTWRISDAPLFTDQMPNADIVNH